MPASVWLRVHEPLGISLMDHLFNKLDVMYPIRWKSAYSSEIMVQNWRQTWAEAFDRKRITPEQIKTGLEECEELYKWPPSLPEFLAACRTVKPAAHRNFPAALTHKSSPEVNREGLRRLKEITGRFAADKRVPA